MCSCCYHFSIPKYLFIFYAKNSFISLGEGAKEAPLYKSNESN